MTNKEIVKEAVLDIICQMMDNDMYDGRIEKDENEDFYKAVETAGRTWIDETERELTQIRRAVEKEANMKVEIRIDRLAVYVSINY